jgi:2-keto-3-deoxy-6-phosphogluconate aldolase
MDIRQIAGLAPVIPIITIDDAATAVPLARALVAGGLPVIEVTLRTDAAVAAAQAMIEQVPEAVVGLGTVAPASSSVPVSPPRSQRSRKEPAYLFCRASRRHRS